MRCFRIGLLCLLGAAFLVSCTNLPRPWEQATSRSVRYIDPFAYCAAVGTIDTPDARYAGPQVPPVIARGLQKAFGVPAGTPLEPFIRNTFWRCMDGKVYACTVGANLPCLEKADTRRQPAPGMVEFCKTRPDADFIPFAVTGRATVYLWRCQGGKPAIVRSYTRPDARGYLAHIWYQIPPDAGS